MLAHLATRQKISISLMQNKSEIISFLKNPYKSLFLKYFMFGFLKNKLKEWVDKAKDKNLSESYS